MPDCSSNYDAEIEDGQNKRTVKCKFCSSVILTPSTASFSSFQVRFFSIFFKNFIINTNFSMNYH